MSVKTEATAADSLPRPRKEKLYRLATVVGIVYGLPVEDIAAPKGTAEQHGKARALLLHLAHTNKVLGDYEIQDYLECSQKNIKDACAQVAGDPALGKTAETVWSAYIAGESNKSSAAKRRVVTLASLTGALSEAFRVEWSEIKMYATERANCAMALEAFVLIGKDLLHKDFPALGRVAGRSDGELTTLYKKAQGEMASVVGPKYSVPLKAMVVRVCNNLDLRHPW